ncbi:MAG: glycosyltransferase family 4 protein [Bacteroidota bacterium]|nr:glycosyltransferase family 4 protein [Bacteroidota bacterium]
MKKILFITPYPKDRAPSQRLKFEQYYPAIRSANYEIVYDTFIDEEFWSFIYLKGNWTRKVVKTLFAYWARFILLFKLKKYDAVYIHLWYTPYGPPIFERFVFFFQKNIIYDIDDMIFLGHTSKANKLLMFMKGKNKMIYLMKNAKHVITCTPHLDSFVRKLNPNTTDISSTINTETYVPVNTYDNKNTLTIGWSGSHSTSKYVYLLEEVLQEISKKHKVRLLVIGDPTFNIEGLDCEAIKWVEKTEVIDLQRIDIGIYPLPNEEWVLGKSGLKALQYMALGIPTIASAIGANHRVIEDGISGTLVNTDADWKKALENYILNPDLRKAHGIKARERVEALYSIKANEPVYLEVINKVIDSK